MRRGQIITNPIHEENHGTSQMENIVSGALFDFLGLLTTLEDPITVGAKYDATVPLKKMVDWAWKERGLNTIDADVMNWHKRLDNKKKIARELVRVASLLSSSEKKMSEKEIEAEKKRSTKKVNAVKTLAENITSLRHNVTRDLRSEDERTRMTALVIALMDRTAERVGNDESAQNGHFGVTGFKKKHISVDGERVLLKYVGKSGVKHEKSFSDSKISTMVSEISRNKSEEDFLFQCSDGYKVKSDRVNRYLDEYGVTAKDIRGYSANRLMIDALKRQKCPSEESERKKIFLAVLKRVAEQVGHGSQMLRNSYLIPKIESSWIRDGKIEKLSD
jgi:DNA topoisomerase-1